VPQDNRAQTGNVLEPACSELLELAGPARGESAHWRAEFAWLLHHPALGSVPCAGAPVRPLSPQALCEQQATRFPLVSGDAAWLSGQSVPVLARRLAPALARDHHVCLDLNTVCRHEGPPAARGEQLRLVATALADTLPAALARHGATARRLLLSVSADHPGLAHLLRLSSCAAAGHPPVVIRLPDSLLLALHGGEGGAQHRDAPALWQGLTGLAHQERGVHLVLQHTTRPACALAGNERADAVLPVSLFEAGADTAWPALQLDLAALQASTRTAALAELRRLLRAMLRLADNVVDQLDWPSRELAEDALVNRRLAVHVAGIGDLVDRWGLDPAAFSSVRLAMRWLGVVRGLMLRESNALARERGPFPGLELRDIASTLARSLGEERASRLLRRAGLRHRHLLVLSPYAVFPRRAPRSPLDAYLHLLPVLRWADTVAMHGDDLAQGLPAPVFRRLLRMTWATARNRP